MLPVLQKAVKNRLMLPLVIRAPKHEGILHPDTHPGKVKACVHKRLAEIQPLRVRMEHIRRAAFFQMRRHFLEGIVQKSVELPVLHAVILDGKPAAAPECDIIRRVRHDEVCFLPVHERRHVFCTGGIAAHQPVPAHRPDIAPLHERRFLQCGGKVEIIILYIFFPIPGKKVGNLVFAEACQRYIKIRALQTFNLNAEHLLIPPRIQSHAVIRKDIGFLLRLCQIIHKHTRHFLHAFLFRCGNPAMPCDNIEIPVDDNRVDEAELPQGRAELRDLLRRVRPRVIHIWH